MPLLPPGCVFSVDRATRAMPGPMPRHHMQRCWDAQDSLGSIPASLPPSWPEIARRSANARRRLHRPPYQPRCRSTNARYRPCGFAHTRKLAPPASLPIRYNTENDCDLVIRIFPRLKQFPCFHFESSLAADDANLCSDWALWYTRSKIVIVLRFCFNLFTYTVKKLLHSMGF